MKKLMFATALAASAAAFATNGTAINATSFEGYTAGGSVLVDKGDSGEDGASGSYFCFKGGDADGSLVKAYGGDNLAKPTTNTYYYGESGDNYLALETEGGTLWRSINTITGNAGNYDLGTATNVAPTGTYLDTLVQFTATEDQGPEDSLTAQDKLAIWLQVDSNNNTTNLMVRANFWDYYGDELQEPVASNFVLNASVEPGKWCRLTVKAIQSVTAGTVFPAFQIFIDGEPVGATTPPFSAGFQLFASSYWQEGMATLAEENKLFPTLVERPESIEDVKLEGVGFKGSGALDEIVWTTDDPLSVPTPPLTFTLTWPDGYTDVSCTTNGVSVDMTGASGSFDILGLVDGDTVEFSFKNADGASKSMTGTVGTDTGLNAEDAVFTWADYLGDAVAGAYQIDDFADLDMLRKGVAAGLATSNETFKQTADIDMTSAGAFAGIGTYAKVPTSGTPFLGTYDGQNFTIANVQRAGGDTQGIFNQVGPSGVIENLVVSNMYWDAALTGEYGFAIVGNAGGGATLRNLTAAGTFASAAKPSTHNIAGIAVRLSPGAAAGAATIVDSCTNNATIYGSYTKLGGINAIVQNQTGFVNGKVVFVNCANNGTLVCKRTQAQCDETDEKGNKKLVTGQAGIVGYFSGTNVELTDCYGNGVIISEDGANTDKNGALVGWTNGGTIKDNGGNSAPVDKKMIGTWGGATETGFLYATVDNGVATTVTTLAKDTEYLLEGNVAASETPVFTLAAANDWIAFNTALGYTFDGTVAAGSGLKVNDATDDTVTTYTAAARATPTVTVTGGANATATWTVNGVAAAAAPETLTEGDTYEVFYTADQGYHFAENAVTTASGTAGTENITIVIDDAVADGPTDPWNTPESGATQLEVQQVVEDLGFSDAGTVITNTASYEAFQAYVKTVTSNADAEPKDLTANQKANAVLCFALNATAIPTTAITEVSIDSIEKNNDGTVSLTVEIEGVTVGSTVDPEILAKVVSAKGGTQLGSLAAENVTVSGYGSSNGKVAITVTPVTSNPTQFFIQTVINK